MNETYESILSLIEHYIILGNPIDEEYIYQLIAIIIEKENLEEYIKKINTYSAGKGTVYTPVTGQIGINIQKLQERIRSHQKNRIGKQRISFQYLEATKLILKELEYAKQLRDCDDLRKNDIQTRILRLSYSKYIKLLQTYTNSKQEDNLLEKQWEVNSRFSSLAPEERLANLETYDTLEKIAKDLNLESSVLNEKDLVKIILTPYTIVREKTYHQQTSPTLYYLKNLSRSWEDIKEIKKIEKDSKELSDLEKFRLGLPNQIEEKMNAPMRRKVLIQPEKNCYSESVVLQ